MTQTNELPFAIYDEEARCWLTAEVLIGTAYDGALKAYRGEYAPLEDQDSTTFGSHQPSPAGAVKAHRGMHAPLEDQDSMTVASHLPLAVCFKSTAADQESEAFRALRFCAEISGSIPSHPNILGIQRSFTVDNNLYVTFPSDSVGSIRSVMISHYRQNDGLQESIITAVLKEALKGLVEIHRNGKVHREFTAAHIYLGEAPNVRLAFSATVHSYGSKRRNPGAASLSVPSPLKSAAPSLSMPLESIAEWGCAPEVYNSANSGYSAKADIWLFGVTALELAYSGFNVSSREEFLTVVDGVRKDKKLPWKNQLGKKAKTAMNSRLQSWGVGSPSKKRQFSKMFEEMVIKCLAEDPGKRPSANELLMSKNFTATTSTSAALRRLYDSLEIGFVKVEEGYV